MIEVGVMPECVRLLVLALLVVEELGAGLASCFLYVNIHSHSTCGLWMQGEIM